MKEKLPHSTASLVLGICSIVLCCCYGLPSVILGIIGFIQGNKAITIHNESPDQFDGVGNAKAGKIMAIIGAVFGIIMLLFYAYLRFNPDIAEELRRWAEEQQAMQR